MKANRRTGHLINVGSLPHPTEAPCADCGHPAAHWCHHHGYEHLDDVVPLCTACHLNRHAWQRNIRPIEPSWPLTEASNPAANLSPPHLGPKHYSAGQICKILGDVPAHWPYRIAVSPGAPPHVRIGRRIWFEAEAFDAWLAGPRGAAARTQAEDLGAFTDTVVTLEIERGTSQVGAAGADH